MKMAGDIAGSEVVTIPSERDLENPEAPILINKNQRLRLSSV
ncbi:MAG: hypothetical protein ABFD18_18890 [Syntrophomonas sp.]